MTRHSLRNCPISCPRFAQNFVGAASPRSSSSVTFGTLGYFSDAHLFCPPGRPGRRQVHKINTGHQQDKKGNDGKYTHISNVSLPSTSQASDLEYK